MMADKPFRLDRRHLKPADDQPENSYLTDQLISWPEFWAHDHGTEEWLAWPIIPAHRQIALYAPAKTGKSIIALAVCAALATGQPILGQPTQPPKHILYCDYEMTAGDLQERLESLGYDADTDLTHLHYALLPTLPPLNTTQGAVALSTLAATVHAELVVIDTMGRAIDVGDENSSTAYQEFARTTGLTLKAAGHAVLRTDHAGKERDRGQRGTSAKNDDVDVVLRIDTTEGGWTLTRTHTRIAWVPEKVVINLTDHPDGTIELTVNTETRTYTPGTKTLADLLRNHGATATTTRRQASDILTATGEKARNKRVCDALAWIRAETPTFTTEPDSPRGDASVHVEGSVAVRSDSGFTTSATEGLPPVSGRPVADERPLPGARPKFTDDVLDLRDGATTRDVDGGIDPFHHTNLHDNPPGTQPGNHHVQPSGNPTTNPTSAEEDETPGHSVGDRSGDQWGPGDQVSGDRSPPLKGDRHPTPTPNPTPNPDPRLDFDPFN